jgi:hypothetical protein
MIWPDRNLMRLLDACVLVAGALLALTMLPSVAPAQDAAANQEIIESARETLSDGAYPWYDAEKDQLYPLEFEEPWDLSWLLDIFNLGSIFKVVVYTLLGLVIAAIVWALVMYAKNRQPAPQAVRVVPEGAATPDQVEALQFLEERPRGDLLGQARKHYEQGNYSEAIIYLFSHELVELDKFSLIHLAKGKTNRQYLREASRVTPLSSPLERTLLTFESVFFGRRPLDRAGFEACWHELPRFEQLLRGST